MATIAIKTMKNGHIVADEFRCFRKSSLALSSRRRILINQFSGQWIAVYNGDVVANSPKYKDVLKKIDRKDVPRNLTIMRFIEKKPGAMIL